MTELPRLLDCKAVMRELGVTRGVAESFMRDCEKIRKGRRVFVTLEDLRAAIEASRVTAAGFPKGRAA